MAALFAPAVVTAAPEATAAPGSRLPAPALGEHRGLSAHIRAHQAARQRAQRRRVEREMASFPPILHRIAQCESHGDPRAIGGGGLYRGAFQFSQSTWANVGGSGDPVDAPLVEQYRRAAILLERSGPGQWPSCAA